MPIDYFSNKLKMMSDLFSLPEACLLADVVQHFRNLNAEVRTIHEHHMLFIHYGGCSQFHPLYIYQDVQQTLKILHSNGTIHQQVIDNPSRYLDKSPGTKEYLVKLRKEKKNVRPTLVDIASYILTNGARADILTHQQSAGVHQRGLDAHVR